MKISVTFHELSEADLKKLLAAAAVKGKAAQVDEDEDEETEEEEAPPKKTRAKKSAPVDEEEEEETEEADEDEGPTRDTVIKAFKAYIKANDRKAGQLVLKKLKAETVSDIDEKDYGKALKLLAV